MDITLNGIRRSGKSYVADLISQSGISRSSIIEQAGVPGEVTAQSFHIVRHPLDAIASLRSLTEAEWLKQSELIEQVRMTDSVLRRSMMLYYHGNRFAWASSIFTIRIEDITPGTMRQVFDISSDNIDFTRVPTDQWKITVWADLKREDIRGASAVADLGRKFGYDTPIITSNSTCAGCI